MKFYTIRQAMDHLGEGPRRDSLEYSDSKDTSKPKGVRATNRARVLVYVRSVKFTTIQEVANAVGMTYPGAAAHLHALYLEGLLKKETGGSFGHINGPRTPKSIYIAVKEKSPCVE